jgi:hypothetical protein
VRQATELDKPATGTITPVPEAEFGATPADLNIRGGTFDLTASLITADGTQIVGVSTDNNTNYGTLWACT